MKIYEFGDYKKFVNTWVKSLPKKGRGEYLRIARALKMHTTLVSQVFKGPKELTFEQGCALCDHLGLNERETDYFLKLLQLARAGTPRSRAIVNQQLARLKAEADEVASRIPQARKLTEADRAIFYSSWEYTAVRLLTSIPEFQTLEAISARLRLSKARTRAILDFLLEKGLCLESEGRIRRGPANTHVEASSPLAVRHHANWRIKAFSRLENVRPEELAFTSPVSLARADLPIVRKILLNAIEEIARTVKNSPEEEVACLNIDWLGF